MQEHPCSKLTLPSNLMSSWHKDDSTISGLDATIIHGLEKVKTANKPRVLDSNLGFESLGFKLCQIDPVAVSGLLVQMAWLLFKKP